MEMAIINDEKISKLIELLETARRTLKVTQVNAIQKPIGSQRGSIIQRSAAL